MLTSSELTTRRQSRTTYANHIIQAQKVAQGCATRISIGGDEGTLASDITLLHEGAVFTTVEEQAAILAANNCTPTVKQLVYAIPDFRNTTTTEYTANNVEPATWQVVASGLPYDLMNGTYITTASHITSGDNTSRGTNNCFKRIKVSDTATGWRSRYASNYYNGSGVYVGTTSNIISGIPVLGEYMIISAPYYFVLNSYSLVSGHMNDNPPTTWILAGSKDGITYTTIDVQTNPTWIYTPTPEIINGYSISIELPSNTKAYNTYMIKVIEVGAVSPHTVGGNSVNIDAFNLFTYM